MNREWLLWRSVYRWCMRADLPSFVILSPSAKRRNLPGSWPTDRQGVYCRGDGWLQSSQHYRPLSDSRFELRVIVPGNICKKNGGGKSRIKTQVSVEDECLWHLFLVTWFPNVICCWQKDANLWKVFMPHLMVHKHTLELRTVHEFLLPHPYLYIFIWW